MKLKVCGMRDDKNIEALIALKPDFIGFIFHEKSPRNVSEIPKINIPNSIKKVGVFVDKNLSFINEKIIDYGLDYIQLHGNETPEFCRKLRNKSNKIIKAFNINDKFDFKQLKAYHAHCDLFLFDAFGKNAGGNGVTFNWDLLQNYQGKTPFLLSGGIDKNMSKQIKAISHPNFIGIDINSGFEIKPALKNIIHIKQFIHDLQG
jgi:phosphoribosylanthranilate isomerase